MTADEKAVPKAKVTQDRRDQRRDGVPNLAGPTMTGINDADPQVWRVVRQRNGRRASGCAGAGDNDVKRSHVCSWVMLPGHVQRTPPNCQCSTAALSCSQLVGTVGSAGPIP